MNVPTLSWIVCFLFLEVVVCEEGAPKNVKIALPEDTVYECTADAAQTFKWSRDGEDLPSGVTVEGEIGQRLRFPDLTTDYDGIYICEASNPYGTASTSIHRFGYMGNEDTFIKSEL